MKTTVALIVAFCLTLTASAMPPAPDVIEKMRQTGTLNALSALHREARDKGVNAPFLFKKNRFRRDGVDDLTLRVICILVDFEDNQANAETNPAEFYQQLLFSEGETETGSMRDWYLENSYGQVHIVGEVVGWYRMPNNYAYYVDGHQGFGAYPHNAQRLTEDAIAAADADVDFSTFDNDEDHVVEGLFIVHAGVGAEESGSQDLIWSHAWGVPGQVRGDGMRFATYAMEPENGHIGVFGHELGHSLFGLPDLYDVTYQSGGVGFWSMMSGGAWGGGGYRPIQLDVYCKMKAGFLDPFKTMNDSPDLVLEPIEESPDALKLWRRNEQSDEYFLVENRQKIGYDSELPGSGLLIWHIDENTENNTHPWWPGNTENGHYLVALEQADGNYDIEHNANGGDDGDPWPGVIWNDLFDSQSVPASNDYQGDPTGIRLSWIESDQNNRMRCDLALEGSPTPVEPILFLLERIPADHKIVDPDSPDGDSTDEASLVVKLLRQIDIWPTGRGTFLPENIYDYNVVLYLESWRDSADPLPGLTEQEQSDLAVFLEIGGKLILVGPDVAQNLQSDTTLWNHLHAEFISDGEDRVTGNVSDLFGNNKTRFLGQNFINSRHGVCDHYVDQINPGPGAQTLFFDQDSLSRGVVYSGRDGSRVILQSTLFGGMMEWGGHKTELLQKYFQFLQFSPMEVATSENPIISGDFRLTSAYPNPFNETIRLSWTGAQAGAQMFIFDAQGRHVGRLILNAPAGSTVWSAHSLPTGRYFLKSPGAVNAPIGINLIK